LTISLLQGKRLAVGWAYMLGNGQKKGRRGGQERRNQRVDGTCPYYLGKTETFTLAAAGILSPTKKKQAEAKNVPEIELRGWKISDKGLKDFTTVNSENVKVSVAKKGKKGNRTEGERDCCKHQRGSRRSLAKSRKKVNRE